jgi:UDP:flavonoid glycosyltransferase YjiC (YdhE family)
MRVGVASHGATGHIYPLLSFADVLLAADHDVIILTGLILALPTPAERINALIALVA